MLLLEIVTFESLQSLATRLTIKYHTMYSSENLLGTKPDMKTCDLHEQDFQQFLAT